MSSPAGDLRAEFLGWQCRIRQHAMRTDAGRPSEGMRPTVVVGGEPVGRITVVLHKSDLGNLVAELRHMHAKTNDPAARHDSVLRLMVAGHFQRPETFSDEMTALFDGSSKAVAGLVAAKRVRLSFDEDGHGYDLDCAVRKLQPRSLVWQATYWHNALFNPAPPPDPVVLSFRPGWRRAGTSFISPRFVQQ